MAVELLVGETGSFEVRVVEDRPFDAGGGDVAGHAWVPDPLGHPHAVHLRPEPALEPLRRHADLTNTVPRRQHRQHWLVERAPHDLDLPLGHEAGDAVEVVGMVAVEPLSQRAACVERQPDPGMAFEEFQKRQVAVPVCLLDDAVEVADGLVVVENEDEPDGW